MPFLQMSNDSPTKAPWHLLIAGGLALLVLLMLGTGSVRTASADAPKAVSQAGACATCVLVAERDRVKRHAKRIYRKAKRRNRMMKRRLARKMTRKARRHKIRAHVSDRKSYRKALRAKHRAKYRAHRLKGRKGRAELVAKRRERRARVLEARRARQKEFRRDWNNLTPQGNVQ